MVYYVRADHIGRPVFATNSAGVKVWEATYTPFGGVHTQTGNLPTPRFPGQWFQSESGLHQNWMRDYDPTTGRYLEPDPLGLVDGASVYGYALQNPQGVIDPNGMYAICLTPFGGRICAEAAKQVVVGCVTVITGLYAWIMATDEVDTYCENCEVANDPNPPCWEWYNNLVAWRFYILSSVGAGLSNVSMLQVWIAMAKKYNGVCVPQGFPALDTTFLE